MTFLLSLMRPRWASFRKGPLEPKQAGKLLFLLLVGLIFWLGIFGVSLRVLTYFQKIEELGDILAQKLLLMVLVTFLGLMLFSSILTHLSKLYLSKDLPLVHGLPVPSRTIFTARWMESTLDSSWMVLVYTLPVLIAYGVVYRTGALFYLTILFGLAPLCVVSSAVSSLLVMGMVVVLPAGKVRSIFFFLGLGALVTLYVLFRLLRPERLVNPEAFNSVLSYLNTVGAPAGPWLPSTWAWDALTAALRGKVEPVFFHSALCASAALFFSSGALLTAEVLYFKGYTKTQTAQSRSIRPESGHFRFLGKPFAGPVRALAVKEFKTFWRDQTQWSQIFLMAAIIVIYIYNFSVLPLEKSPIETVYLQNLFSFLNMGLASFVVIAIAARFAYPTVSTEGQAFWIVLSSPIPLRTFLVIKFFIYLLPMLFLSELLIVATNLLLHVTPFMMGLSCITIFFMIPGVVSMGIGLGASYPDFASENPAQTVTSFGGFLFMMISAAYVAAVVILEAGPVYHHVMARLHDTPIPLRYRIWEGAAFSLVLLLNLAALFLPLRLGARRLAVRYGG